MELAVELAVKLAVELALAFWKLCSGFLELALAFWISCSGFLKFAFSIFGFHALIYFGFLELIYFLYLASAPIDSLLFCSNLFTFAFFMLFCCNFLEIYRANSLSFIYKNYNKKNNKKLCFGSGTVPLHIYETIAGSC